MLGWLFPSRQKAYGYGRLWGKKNGAALVVERIGRCEPTGNEDFDSGVLHAYNIAESELKRICGDE